MAFLDYIMEAANALAQEMMSLTLDFFTNLVQWCASASYSFWDASLVNVLLQAGAGVSILVWAVSLIIVIQDVLEAISEEKRVYLGSVIGDSLKAVVFSQASPFLGILVIKFLFQIMALLNWSDSLVASWTDLVAETAGFFFSLCCFCALCMCLQSHAEIIQPWAAGSGRHLRSC